jgi:hypothetical protein
MSYKQAMVSQNTTYTCNTPYVASFSGLSIFDCLSLFSNVYLLIGFQLLLFIIKLDKLTIFRWGSAIGT